MSNDTPPFWVKTILRELRALRQLIEQTNRTAYNPTQPTASHIQQPTERQLNPIVPPMRQLKLHIAGRDVQVNACRYHHRYGAATRHRCQPACAASIEFQRLFQQLNGQVQRNDDVPVNPPVQTKPRIRNERNKVPQLSDSSSSDSSNDDDGHKERIN